MIKRKREIMYSFKVKIIRTELFMIKRQKRSIAMRLMSGTIEFSNIFNSCIEKYYRKNMKEKIKKK